MGTTVLAKYLTGLPHPWILASAVVPILALFARTWLTPLLLLLALAALVFARLNGQRLAFPVPFGLLVGGIVAWGAMSSLWAIDPGQSLERAGKLAAISISGFVLIGAAGTVTSQDRRSIATTFSLGAAFALVAAIFGLIWSGVVVLDFAAPTVSFVPKASIPMKRGMMILSVLPWVAAAGLLAVGRHRLASLCLVFPPLLLFPLSAISALIAWGAGVAGASAGVLVPRKGLVAAIWLTPVIMTGTPLLARLIPTDLSSLAGSLPASALHRLVAWRFTADRIGERPFLGWGIENSRVLPGGEADAGIARFIENRPPDDKDLSAAVEFLTVHPPATLPLHPHNFVLQCWVELGLPGAVLAAVAIMVLLYGVLRLARTRWQRGVTLGLFSATSAMAFLSYGAWQSWWQSALWIMAAFVVVFLRSPDVDRATPSDGVPPTLPRTG